MNVIVPGEISNRVRGELEKAGSREIGGILLGEHTNENEFKISEITIQKTGGGLAFFERIARCVIEPLKRFFARTDYNYKRFNYLGEWHSHPSFSPYPSAVDHSTMQELIMDDEFGANFIVLMIVKLGLNGLDGTVTIYQCDKEPFLGNLIFSQD